MSFSEWDQRCMTLALEEARRAADRDEVPVGAVLARGEVVLAHGGNAQIELHDATAHAEIRVLREAGVRNSNYRLPGTTLYVTLEPCTMFCGALVPARVERLTGQSHGPVSLEPRDRCAGGGRARAVCRCPGHARRPASP